LALTFATQAVSLAAQPDAWITTKVKMSLLTTEGVSGTAINVDTVNGTVTLHGKVASDAEKTKAETTAKAIEGVQGVRNLLQVVAEKREDAVKASDKDVKTNVEKALDAKPTLAEVSVQSVNAGVVLLAGEVPTLSDHLLAIETASRVPGVKRVASEIKSPEKLADAEIYRDRGDAEGGKAGEMAASAGQTASDMWTTTAVKMRLMADSRTPGMNVNVDTQDGAVTLFGIVPSEEAKRAAEEDARKAAGVKAVHNELQVVPSEKQAAVAEKDDVVEQRVEDTLEADTDLRDTNITVDVKNGVARLTGTVPSHERRVRAAVRARSANGVRAIEDDLRVVSN
jgi:osmotically-inducible protein OsmY